MTHRNEVTDRNIRLLLFGRRYEAARRLGSLKTCSTPLVGPVVAGEVADAAVLPRLN